MIVLVLRLEVQFLIFPHESSRGFSLRLFGRAIQAIWIAIFLLTVLDEVYPFPLIPPLPFYAIRCIKLLLFFVLGYLTPFGFWRFRSLGFGIFLAFVSAAFVEVLQRWLGNGHAFHWYELLVKVLLIFFGYCTGCGSVHKRLGAVDDTVKGVAPEWLPEPGRRLTGTRHPIDKM